MLKELDRKILSLCAAKHIGLSAMIDAAAQGDADADPAVLRKKTIAVMASLLEDGLIRAGRPTPDGKAFVAWDLAAKESVERITREWSAQGPAPASAESVWFAATKEGVRVSSGR